MPGETVEISASIGLLSIALTFVWLGVIGWALWSRAKALRGARRAIETLAVLRPALMTCPDAFFLIDDKGRILASEKLREWLGLAMEPRVLTDLFGADGAGFDEGEKDALRTAINQVANSGAAQNLKLNNTTQTRSYCATVTTSSDTLQRRSIVTVWLRDFTDTEITVHDAQREMDHLRHKLLRADALFKASPYPIWRRDADLTITHVNQAYANAVEAPSPQSVITDGVELMGATLAQADMRSAQTALEEGDMQVHTQHVVIGGQRRTLQVFNAPLEDGQGVGGYAIDVTEEENVRAELDRFTRAQAEILNMLSTPVAIFGPEKQLIYHNRAFADVFHLTPSFLSDGPLHGEILEAMREKRRVPEQADFPAWKRIILRHYTTLIEPDVDTWHLPDDTALRVVTQPHPFGGLLILFEDVTERLALQRSFDTLIKVQRATLDNLQEGVAVFGADGHLQLSNDVFSTLWQLRDEDLDGSPHITGIVDLCAPLLNGEDGPLRLRDTVLASTVGRETVSGRLHRSDERVVDYAAVPLPDGAALVTFIDVSDSVRIETALRDRNEALETADRLKSEFVANMSYELRTPLTSIIGFAEMLENEYFGALNKKQSSYIHNILTSSERLMVLINDILDLAVTEAGAMALDVGTIAVPALVNGALAMTQDLARTKSVNLNAKIAPECPTVLGDERRLKQVLYNLITNAIRFTPAGGEISVSAYPTGGAVALEVSDTGVGIQPEEQEKVFERFRKGSNAGHVKSPGLGLSLVRNFVELHGGTVNLESKVGEGTVVTCLIPFKPEEAAGAAQ